MKRADNGSMRGTPEPGSSSGEAIGDVRAFRRALESLDEDHREVIRLLYIHQLSVAETAGRLDRSERSVQSLRARALILLRDRLGGAL